MKAWVLHDINQFTLDDIDKPTPAEGEVLVKVKSVGICGSDIPRVYVTGAHNMPQSIGHEFAGDVVELGTGTDSRWEGKRVGVFPLVSCGECPMCKKKKFEMCRHYTYIGTRRDGAFAEYVAVPEKNLIELSDDVSYEEGAMLEPASIAAHAFRKTPMEKEEKVVIYGMGTIGFLLLMLLKEAGYHNIYAIGNKKEQGELAAKLGLEPERFINIKEDEEARAIGEDGADVVFECVGKNVCYEKSLELAAPGARICLIGNPFTDMNLDLEVYWRILRNQLTISGSWSSTFTKDGDDDWNYVLTRLKSRRISFEDLVTHRYALEDIVKGFEIMRDKTEAHVKIMANLE